MRALGLTVQGEGALGAGGVAMGFRDRTGIDIPLENQSIFPYASPSVEDYYNQRYGPRNWTQAVVLNLAIGQGENSQTVVNMARFYTALATDGRAATPSIVLPPRYGFALDDGRAFWFAAGASSVVALGTHVLIGVALRREGAPA